MLYWNTVNPLLHQSLQTLMQSELFTGFRLVGGTALSLHLGHRMSIDIDLFTDKPYGTVDFNAIDDYLQNTFLYVDGDFGELPAFGKSYLIGESVENHVKLDVYYSTESFMKPAVEEEGIRLADIEDIIAMKIDVVLRGGRKKDFWDLHELIDGYDLAKMLALHKQRHPYTHDEQQIINNFTNFDKADEDLNPVCIRGKYWEFIKDDFVEATRGYTNK